jgi:hypothetical protein
MLNENDCQGCPQKDNCRQAYQKLGETQGPSVTVKSIIAFLVPLVIFICALGISDKIFQKIFATKQLQTAASLGLALAVTLIYILIIKAVSKNGGK